MIQSIIRKLYNKIMNLFYGENEGIFFPKKYIRDSELGIHTKMRVPYRIDKSKIGDYTYISENSTINNCIIGKFCSIGPNVLAGWGIHPKNGISTHPMFYSTHAQNGMTLSEIDKIEEVKLITIGNDVFIGMNVVILDGINISDGAIIGAGTIVSKDVPPYAIAVGNPMKIIGYRFEQDKIDKLLKIKWWNKNINELKDVEQNFFDIDKYINKNIK